LAAFFDKGILAAIGNSLSNFLYDESLVECLSTMYVNLILNNADQLTNFFSINTPDSILNILEEYNPKENNPIILNCILCINQFASDDAGIQQLAETRFQEILFDTLERKNNDSEIIRFSTQLLSNYLSKDLGNNIKRMNFHKLIQILVLLQKLYYYNSDVLININTIAGYIIYYVGEKYLKEKCVVIINESVKIQDWNLNIIQMSFALLIDIFESFPYIIDNVFEEVMLSCLNVMNNHDNSEVLILTCKLILKFSNNYLYTYVMVNNSLVQLISSLFDKQSEIENSLPIRDCLLQIIGLLIPEYHNALKVSEHLMDKLIYYSNTQEFADVQATFIVRF
jgi:hypothetical protein